MNGLHKYNQDKYHSLTNAAIEPEAMDELSECLGVVIEHVRNKHIKESMRFNLKNISKILLDLEDIRRTSPAAHETVLLALTMFPTSYAKIGARRQVSKVAAYKQIQRLAERYEWIADIKLNMCL